ncbi:hypothetical protein EV401DRAFT_2079248 [Pisolithus croceorrhizus]|nr:hypothetical protein EV401DRAFT_2079248 [Pisolithus croceorrhizus]
MNLALSRSGAPHFGTDSMFEASIRDVFGDTTLSMSAPPRMVRLPHLYSVFSPVTSVVALFSRQFNLSLYVTHTQVRNHSFLDTRLRRRLWIPSLQVFCNRRDFKSLEATTDPETNAEVVNYFRIGYKDASEAM